MALPPAPSLIFESPEEAVLDNPDNITISPRGGIILCEDGDRLGQRLIGLTPEGETFPFAENNVVLNGEKNDIVGDFRDKEWAGATYSPDTRWLFVNIQTPGITFAITGPWDKGVLVSAVWSRRDPRVYQPGQAALSPESSPPVP